MPIESEEEAEAKSCAVEPGETKSCFKFNISYTEEGMRRSIRNHLKYTLARDEKTSRKRDWWLATCYAVRDRMIDRYMKTQQVQHKGNVRRMYYFSMEYLMGRLLTDNLYNTGLWPLVHEALDDLGLKYEDLLHEELDMGLGNGGLGRLAACFLDSLATMQYPAIGYGIHYEFGLFRQEFINGRQVEHPDNWLKHGNPWQVARPEYSQKIPVYGRVEEQYDDKGDQMWAWLDAKVIIGTPWDVPIVGYGARTVNYLRLWESKASEEFDFKVFNEGGYVEAVHEKVLGETISKVLYPNDEMEAGKELRLVQQYFFCACSLKDIIRRYRKKNDGWDSFSEKVVIQLNDTHPAIAVIELMRLFLDKEHMDWDTAWGICRKTFAYTNHTLLPEALEKWAVDLFAKVLPRHLQIVEEINRRFLKEVETHWPADEQKKQAMSIIEQGERPMVRMAYLATVASFSINGVAALHTELLKSSLFHDFYELYPNRFNNKTNGVTPRRWLKACNPRLSKLIDSKIGDAWPCDLEKLRGLEAFADDVEFRKDFMAVKRENKVDLAKVIQRECGVEISPDALFDVQIKRLHEYKRQHLNLLHILTLYRRILHNPDYDMHPRVFIFGAKAAPSYEIAKEIIHAINAVAQKVNNDERVRGRIKIAFLPNYNVSLAAQIIPAADLSEQISLAGKEASGTGNMKLALNGALTIGTLDGANVEIKEEVGAENIFIFGMTVEEAQSLWMNCYNSKHYYDNNEELRAVIDWLGSGFFTPDEKGSLHPLRHSLLDGGDRYMALADYESYCKAQEEVDKAYKDRDRWARMAVLNTARMGKFSSDRTIREYAKDIWRLDPINVPEEVD